MDLSTSLLLLGGLVLLVLGAEALVRGSAMLARRLRVSPLVVGLTVVAFGTSTPELVVSVRAALRSSGDIALGNVIGSNIGNVLLILAIAACIRPLRVESKVIRIDIPIMIGVSLLLLLLIGDGWVGRVEGAGLLLGLVGYTGLSVWLARREAETTVLHEFEEALPGWPRAVPAQIALIVVGLALLVWGADMFVRGATVAAGALGVSEALIGLTVVAVGTSLPELMTTVVAALKNESDIAVGNVVGSNIFNILAVLGSSALLRPLGTSGIVSFDYVVLLAAALVLLPMAWTGRRLSRQEAVLLLLGYVAYVVIRATFWA